MQIKAEPQTTYPFGTKSIVLDMEERRRCTTINMMFTEENSFGDYLRPELRNQLIFDGLGIL